MPRDSLSKSAIAYLTKRPCNSKESFKEVIGLACSVWHQRRRWRWDRSCWCQTGKSTAWQTTSIRWAVIFHTCRFFWINTKSIILEGAEIVDHCSHFEERAKSGNKGPENQLSEVDLCYRSCVFWLEPGHVQDSCAMGG